MRKKPGRKKEDEFNEGVKHSDFRLLCSMMFDFSGYWNIIVYGRKHSYRLYTKMLNEAMRWTAAIQGVIDSKTPIETPTLQLIRDIKVKQIQWPYHKIF